MALISISGKIGSGKDTVGQIIQYLTACKELEEVASMVSFTDISKQEWSNKDNPFVHNSGWQIKKFAGKVKEICSILTGIPVADFEKQEVKDRVLGEEWTRYGYADGFYRYCKDGEETTVMNNKQCSKERYEREFRVNWPTAYKLEYTVRLLLQRVGTDAMRNQINENVWVNALFADYKELTRLESSASAIEEVYTGEYPNWIITDTRFENEAEAIKSRDGLLIRVKSDCPCPKCGERENIHSNVDYSSASYKVDDYLCNECGTTFERNTHPSETSLDNYQFDEVIDNNSTIEELIEKVKQILIKHKLI